ncbi:MAG: ATP synthase subunit I [Cocleimonas sp.]
MVEVVKVSRSILAEVVTQNVRKTRVVQLIVICLAAVFFYLRSLDEAYAALYGGFISFFLIWTLSWTMIKASEIARTDAKKGIMVAYISAVVRFVFILVFFAVGIGVLGLEPLPLVLTAIIVWLIGTILPGVLGK